MTPEPTPLVTVLPCDQGVANAIYQHFGFNGGTNFDVSNRVLQLVARHRLAALEEAAKVAESLPIGGPTLSSWINTNESPMGATRRNIATAIRALSNKTGEGKTGCPTCGGPSPDDDDCLTCARWWRDNPPPADVAHPTPGDSPCKP